MNRFATLALLVCMASPLAAQTYTVLGGWDASGVPDYLTTPDVIDPGLMDVVSTSLPESIPVPDGHPEFLAEGNALDLRITQEADVWVTFVLEGAGYRNALGFYTYDLDAPPQTPSDIAAHTLIFPNVSAQWSGGGLTAGDKVHLGRFPAGTGIGWFLVANGWNGSTVGDGLHRVYSEPSFNPESDVSLQQHSVLLRDDAREILLLGFEDLRRDGNSDEDFNDAVFYVSATPYEAIELGEVAVVDTPGPTTGGNEGGLESNGDLAEALAVRMFSRGLAPEARPVPFAASGGGAAGEGKLSSYDVLSLIPETGPLSSTAFVTTPSDLVGLTNATAVFAGDYLRADGSRLAALFAATTPAGDTYDHTKVICDRLRGAVLTNVRHVGLHGRRFVLSTLVHPDGSTDYAVSFVAYPGASGWTVDSRFMRGEYRPPASGDEVLNVQVWSASPTYTIQLATSILDGMAANGPLAFANETPPALPSVVVRSGEYRHGTLRLTVANAAGATQLTLEGRGARTESGATETFQHTIALPQGEEVEVAVPVGTLFDAVFTVSHDADASRDQLYLADGAWGAYVDPNGGSIQTVTFSPEASSEPRDGWPVERGIAVVGVTSTWASVFRYLTPDGDPVDLTAYDAIAFTASGSGRPSLRIGKVSLEGWDQFGERIDLTDQETQFVVRFEDLSRFHSADAFSAEDLTSISFVWAADASGAQAFSIDVRDIAFVTYASTASGEAPVSDAGVTVGPVSPNPVTSSATIEVSLERSEDVRVSVIDTLGRVVAEGLDGPLGAGPHRLSIPTEALAPGTYLVRLTMGGAQEVRKLVRTR